MELKSFKEIGNWKRHDVSVKFIYHEEGQEPVQIYSNNFDEVKLLDRLKMVIAFDGEDVYETGFGALGIKETSFKLLKRKGIMFRTVERHVEFLGFDNVLECDQFINWCNHFRISNQIQEVVRLKFIETYNDEIREVKMKQTDEMKYIKMW